MEHVTDLLPAYALGSLDDDELAVAAEHLAACPVCRAELAEYQALTDQLPLALPQFTPPAALKTRIMSGVANPASGIAHPAAEIVRPPAQPRRRAQFWEAFQRRTPIWAAAGAFVILLLFASNLLMWNQVSRLSESALPTISLQGVGEAAGAAGTIITGLDGRRGTLVVDRLPQLQEGQQYQLWLIADGQRDSGGVFSVGKDGYGYLYVYSKKPLNSFDSFGITIEPTGGSPGPTGTKVMGGGA